MTELRPDEGPASTIQEGISPNDDRNETHRQVALLRDQVALLQIESAQRRKPWYKEKSVLISLASLFIAGFTAGERVWVRYEETIQQQVVRLRETMIGVSELQAEWQGIQTAGGSDPHVYARGIALNGKRQLLLQNAAATLRNKSVHALTSPNIFLSLGYEMMADGRYKEAESHFLDGINAAARDADELTLVWAERTLGQLYRLRGTSLADSEVLQRKSRSLFESATRRVDGRTDDFGHKTFAETLILQAQNEIAYGDAEFGKTVAARAKQRIEKLTPGSFRASLLTIVQPLLAGELTASPPGAPPSPTPIADAAKASATQPTDALQTGHLGDSVLEIWEPLRGSVTGAEMQVVIDGRSVGRLSNLKGATRITLGMLTNGSHQFQLDQLSFFAIDPDGKSTLFQGGGSCRGTFISTSDRLRRLWIRGGNGALSCGIQ